MTDTAIVDMYWGRDESAISETQKKYNGYLTKTAFNVLANLEDSAEIVNDTYLKAWNSMPSHRPERLATYLGKIARQAAIDLFRKRGANKRQSSQYTVSLSELEDCVPCSANSENSPTQAAESKLLTETIDRWLATLPDDTRNVFVGRYYHMDSLKRVAEYCGMSESKAKSVLFRARNALKEHLEKEGFVL
jgi:RNA polymerase sigma-70 factor (ECF subfamily)